MSAWKLPETSFSQLLDDFNGAYDTKIKQMSQILEDLEKTRPQVLGGIQDEKLDVERTDEYKEWLEALILTIKETLKGYNIQRLEDLSLIHI